MARCKDQSYLHCRRSQIIQELKLECFHKVFGYLQLKDYLAFHNKIGVKRADIYVSERDWYCNLLPYAKTCLTERDEHRTAVHRFNKAVS